MKRGTRPNIIVFMSDQHRASVLGCAGDEVVQTPHIDRLAAQGVRFAICYAGSPLCVPSRATFLMGQGCSDVGVWSNSCTMPSDIPTFLHSLAAAGYETVLCGRMHFKGPDQRHGFERRIMGDVTGPIDGWPNTLLGDISWSSQGQGREGVTVAGPGRTGFQAYDVDVTAAAVRFLRERGASHRLSAGQDNGQGDMKGTQSAQAARSTQARQDSQSKQSAAGEGGDDRPFCLVIGWVSPHNPYIAPAPLFDQYRDRVSVPEVPPGIRESEHPALRHWHDGRGTDGLTAAQARTARAGYYGLVTWIDQQVGQILSTAEESGLAADTAVIYTSDHGDMLGENGLWQKSYLFDPSVSVPLIVSWLGQTRAASVVTEPVSLTDLAPTLIDLCGGPPLPNATGRVLTPLLRGEPLPDTWRPEVYVESMHVSGFPPSRMVRRERWKLMRYHGFDTPQLFDLEADPHERHDRAGDPGCAAIRASLDALVLQGWSGAEVARAVRRHVIDAQLTGAWAQALHPHQPDLWKAPPHSNVFPEHAVAASSEGRH